MDSNTSNSDDNPFAGPKVQTQGKVSVQMPADDWLCRKLSKLNITMVEGYSFRSSEAGERPVCEISKVPSQVVRAVF